MTEQAPGKPESGFEDRLAASVQRHRAVLDRLGAEEARPLSKAFKATRIYRLRPELCELLASRGWSGATFRSSGRVNGLMTSPVPSAGTAAEVMLTTATHGNGRDLRLTAGPAHSDGLHGDDSWSAEVGWRTPDRAVLAWLEASLDA